jgi:hypothetical protein
MDVRNAGRSARDDDSSLAIAYTTAVPLSGETASSLCGCRHGVPDVTQLGLDVGRFLHRLVVFPRSRREEQASNMEPVDRTTAQLQSYDLQKGPRKRPLLVLGAAFGVAPRMAALRYHRPPAPLIRFLR